MYNLHLFIFSKSKIKIDNKKLGCGKQVLGVRAAKTTIERVREFGVLIFLFDFTY